MLRKLLTTIFLLLLTAVSYADDNVLNVYNWTDYIPNSVIKEFEQKTGITVNYNEFTSNDEMYAKLRANPNIGYDVVFPSSYFTARMAHDKMLQPLDLKQIPNLKYVDPTFLNPSYDPQNRYSVPFFWGATIIGINKKYIDPNSITSWRDLWQPRFKDQVLLLGDIRDAYAVPLILNGDSINTRDPEQLKQGYLLLKTLWPNVKIISSDGIPSLFADEDVTIGVAWSADIFSANQDNPDITGVYPKESFAVWMDNMVVMRNAPHLANAYKFINFILQPEITAEIAENTNYSTVNMAAKKLLPPEMRNSPILYPSKKTLARAQFEGYTGDADLIYKNYWERFRADA
ncbi:MAG: spermidine/putrescine ABC transporter substrate-binding protein [Gammaproteobacteria bacterium]|nr:spermidine/putrescine ABC transporter substrate-binding protein [Gammaproteobacteria bacterium]